MLINDLINKVTNPAAPLEVRKAILLLWAMLLLTTLADLLDVLFLSGSTAVLLGGLVCTLFASAFPYYINARNNLMRNMYGISTVLTLAWQFGGPKEAFFAEGAFSTFYADLAVPLFILSLYWLFKESSRKWFAHTTKSMV